MYAISGLNRQHVDANVKPVGVSFFVVVGLVKLVFDASDSFFWCGDSDILQIKQHTVRQFHSNDLQTFHLHQCSRLAAYANRDFGRVNA